MRIAMVISTPFPPEEGIGYYTYNLSKKLIEIDYEVTIITRGNHSGTEILNYEGIKVIKPRFLPLYPFHVQLHSYFVKNVLKKLYNNFDLIHIHSPLSPVVNVKIPIIGTIHTSLIEDMKHFQISNFKSIGIKATTYTSGHQLTQKLIDHSKVITTVSSAVANELIKYYNIKNPIVVGNGVNENKFFPLEEKEDNYILFVGRLDYRKGIMDLVNASIFLKNFNIYIAGKGPLKSYIQKFINKNNITNIKLLGHVSGKNLVKLYQNASMFVFPSYYEGLPTVLLEAMSCGLPVIVTDIPAHEDLVENRKNGLLIKKNSPKDIIEKIDILVNDRNLRRKLGLNARKTIEKNFTWNIICKKYHKIYEDILNSEKKQ